MKRGFSKSPTLTSKAPIGTRRSRKSEWSALPISWCDLLRADQFEPLRFKFALFGCHLRQLAPALPHPRLDFDFEINLAAGLKRNFRSRILIFDLKNVVAWRNRTHKNAAVINIDEAFTVDLHGWRQKSSERITWTINNHRRFIRMAGRKFCHGRGIGLSLGGFACAKQCAEWTNNEG